MLRIFLALWLATTPAFAWAGSMTLLGVGKVGGGVVGPPVFTFQNFGAGSNSSPVLSIASAAGTPASTRFIEVFFRSLTNGSLPTTAVFNAASGSPVTATVVAFGASPSSFLYGIAYAVVPSDVSGGGVTLDITVTGGSIFGGGEFALYTADSSQFVNLMPVTNFASVTSSPGVTGSVNVLLGGAVQIFGGPDGGVNTVSLTIPNDPPVSLDGNFFSLLAAHKNNSAAFTPASVSLAFGSPDAGAIALAAWK